MNLPPECPGCLKEEGRKGTKRSEKSSRESTQKEEIDLNASSSHPIEMSNAFILVIAVWAYYRGPKGLRGRVWCVSRFVNEKQETWSAPNGVAVVSIITGINA